MGLFEPEGSASGLRGSKRQGSTGDVADPKRPHELQPWQPAQLVGMPLSKLRVLGFLADDRVLDQGVTEVVDHGSEGEHPTQTVVQARLSHLLFLLLYVSPRMPTRSRTASPARADEKGPLVGDRHGPAGMPRSV